MIHLTCVDEVVGKTIVDVEVRGRITAVEFADNSFALVDGGHLLNKKKSLSALNVHIDQKNTSNDMVNAANYCEKDTLMAK